MYVHAHTLFPLTHLGFSVVAGFVLPVPHVTFTVVTAIKVYQMPLVT